MILRLSKSKLVYVLFMCTFLVEAINGLMVNSLGFEFSIIGYIYRGIVILYFGKQCLHSSRFTLLLSLSWVLMLFACLINTILFHSNIKFDFIVMLKCCVPVTMSLGLFQLLQTDKINRTILKKILYDSIFILILIYAVSIILGIGYVTYDGTSGYKAIFNSVNAITFAITVILSYQFSRFLHSRNKIYDGVLLMVLALMLLLLGSKSGIVFAIGYIVVKSVFIEKHTNNKFRNIVLGMLIGVLIYYILTHYFTSYINAILERTRYFFMQSNSTMTFLLSGRNKLMQGAIEVFQAEGNVMKYLTGMGFYNSEMRLGYYLGSFGMKAVEMDLVDLFLGVGILGVAATYGITMYLFLIHVKDNLRLRRYEEMLIFFMAIAFSILGGHVFTDSLGSSMLAITVAMCFPQENNLECMKV